MTRRIEQAVKVDFRYPVIFTENAFHPSNMELANLIHSSSTSNPKLLVVLDENVHKSHRDLLVKLSEYAHSHQIEMVSQPLIVTGGEQVKATEDCLKRIYEMVADYKIDRHSYILAIGGGAVLDAVGYAAATAHRGIRLVRMPTTVLAQNDAGIGVKNGINWLDRKNFLGSFAPPFAVINDYNFLQTLEARDKRAGIAEAIKVALIKDKLFFENMYKQRADLANFEDKSTEYMIYRCAELHLQHISSNGDPFEMGSARPLDFGHWSAHKLEYLSNYQLRHGEAVAIGIALDSIYSSKIGILDKNDCEKILQLLVDLGFELYTPELLLLNLRDSLEEFREHLGGNLCITLLTGIGTSIETNTIDLEAMADSLNQLISYKEKAKKKTG